MRGQNMMMLLRAVDLLSTKGGVTKATMAEELEVDRKSVDRLISLLEDLNFPIEEHKDHYETEKRWSFIEEYVIKLPNIHVPDIRLSLSEIMALYLIRGEARLFRGTEIEKKVDAAFYKLSLFLPKGFFEQLSKIRTLFVPSSKFAKDYTGKEEIIDKLREAMVQMKVCSIRYHSFKDDKVKDYAIEPLHFFEDNGGLYVMVNIPSYGEIRTLAVERIQHLDLTDSTFHYPSNFDPDSYLNATFGIIRDKPVSVKVRFSADVARYIKERQWAKGQKISKDADSGGIVLEMDTWGWLDVKRWVLSYGPNAEVLEPEELREEIAGELESAAGNYRKFRDE